MNYHPKNRLPTAEDLQAFLKVGARAQAEVARAIELRSPALFDRIGHSPEAPILEKIYQHALQAAAFSACAELHGINFFEAILQSAADIRNTATT